jgi:hypothetical protein
MAPEANSLMRMVAAVDEFAAAVLRDARLGQGETLEEQGLVQLAAELKHWTPDGLGLRFGERFAPGVHPVADRTPKRSAWAAADEQDSAPGESVPRAGSLATGRRRVAGLDE